MQPPLGAPVSPDTIGALFGLTSEAVVLIEGDRVVAWNASAERLFGRPAEAAVGPVRQALGDDVDVLLALGLTDPPVRVRLTRDGVVDAVRREVGGRQVLLLRDVGADVRRADGLQRLAALSRDLLDAPSDVAELLQGLCAEIRSLTRAAYSAVLVLREGSLTEISHFAYDAPRHLFPARMPRVVGLLAVPVRGRAPARLSDMRGHPAGVGLPGVHPPMGPLLAVPLLARDQVLGVLAAAQPPGARQFDEVDEALLCDLSAHAVAALRWAQASHAERERAQRRREVLDAARHDIRSPVGAGKGYAQLLQRRMDRMSPEQVQTALAGLVDTFDRIESFSQRLLLDDQVEYGVEPVWSEIPLGPLLQQVARDVAVATGRDDAVQVDVHADAPSCLAGDREMVREVLDNLVGNALKHAGSATLTARAEGPHVRIDVRDEGPGIPESEQADLFDRWTRGSAARRERVAGMGLGLSIVKRLVVAHGGLLGVSSRPGEGATFWVTFPTSPPTGDTAPADPGPGDPAPVEVAADGRGQPGSA